MATLRLQIVTPERVTLDEQVQSVVLPSVGGELGILPAHTPLMTQLEPGELRVVQNGKTSYLAIGEGFAEVKGDSVSVLTDMAVGEDAIDEQKTQEAIDRARKALSETSLVGEELEATQAALARSVAQIHLKRRRRTGSS